MQQRTSVVSFRLCPGSGKIDVHLGPPTDQDVGKTRRVKRLAKSDRFAWSPQRYRGGHLVQANVGRPEPGPEPVLVAPQCVRQQPGGSQMPPGFLLLTELPGDDGCE